MAIKISGTTVIDDSRNLTNINSGAILGIQSAGVSVGSGATTLNFVGAGNTFAYDPGTRTLDISIQGGGGGAGVSSTGILTCRGISNSSQILESIQFDDFFGNGSNYAMIGPISVGSTATVTVGAGVSYVII
jgi:hypothetical protein